MSANTGVWLEDLTWPEAKSRYEAGALVVIPVGAASKAHGPHLPPARSPRSCSSACP